MCLQKLHFPLEFFPLTFTGFYAKIFKFPHFLGLSLTFHDPFCKRYFSPWLSRPYVWTLHNYIPFIWNYYHKKSNIPSCAFMTSFSSETKIKFSSGLDQAISPGALPWLKGCIFLSRTCSIQIESYILPPKVSRKFTKTLLTKHKPQFQGPISDKPITKSYQPSPC